MALWDFNIEVGVTPDHVLYEIFDLSHISHPTPLSKSMEKLSFRKKWTSGSSLEACMSAFDLSLIEAI